MILQYLLLSIAIFAIYIAEAYNIAVNIAVLAYIAVNIGTSKTVSWEHETNQRLCVYSCN